MYSRIESMLLKMALVAVIGLSWSSLAAAQTIVNGDVTTNLNGTFFVDDAVTGGNDVTTNDNSSPRNIGPRFWDLDGNGQLDDVGVPGTVTVEGFGFATSGTASANDATSVDLTFIYLGADQILSGDDVTLGTRTVGYNHTGAGEYFINFSSPISGAIDGLGQKFLLQLTVNDLDPNNQESIRFKAQSLMFETFSGPKLSVSGGFDIDAIIWDVDGSGNWNTAGNWNPNTVPGVGGEAGGNALLGDAISGPATVTLDVNADLGALIFQSANSYTVTDGGGSNTITLSGGAAVTALNGAHEIDAAIVGSSGLTKAGTGTIALSGTNTYTGTTNIRGGTLAISDNSNLGNAANAIDFDTGTLRIDGTTLSSISRNVTMTGNGTVSVFDPNHSVDITGAVSGSGLFVKAGEGTLTLSNAAGHTGDIHVNVGTLVVDNNNGLGDTTGTTKIDAGGGTVDLDGSGGSLTIAEDFNRLQGRFDGVPESHIRNIAGNNSLTGTLDASGDGFSNVRIENAAAGTTLTINNSPLDPALLLDSDDEDLQFVFKGTGDIKVGNENTPGSGRIVGSGVNVIVAMDDPTDSLTIATAEGSSDTSNATGFYWGGTTTVQSGTMVVLQDGILNNGELRTTTIDVQSGATFDVSDFAGGSNSSYSLQVVTVDPNDATNNVGQRLTGAGTVVTNAATLNAFEDSIIAPGDSAGTLNVTGNLAVTLFGANTNGGFEFELSDSAGGTNDLLAVSNQLTLTPGANSYNLRVTPINGDLDTSAYTIMTSGSPIAGGAGSGNFNISVTNEQGTALDTRQDDSASVSVGTNNVTVSFSPAQSHNWTGNSDNQWVVGTTDPNGVAAPASNWSSSDNLFYDLDTVTFGDGTGQTTVDVAETASPGGVIFTNVSDTYTFTGGGIEGSGDMTLNANANVVLANNGNSFTGNISIAGGASLTLGDGSTGGLDTIGLDNDIAISATGVLNHNDVNGETLNGVISGAGEVRNTAGTLTLGGNNTYSGPTVINGGTIVIANTDTGTPLGSLAAGTTVNPAASLRANGQTGTIAEAITLNGGTLAAGGAANSAVTFSTNVTITGDGSTIRSDGDTGDDGLTIDANVVGTGGNSLNVFAGNNGTVNVTGSITNNGSLTKRGTGTLALTSASSSISAPTIDVQVGDIDVTAVTAGLALSGQTLSGGGTVTGNTSTAASSTIRVGAVAGGVPFVTSGLQLHYDAAQDTPGDASWEDLSDGGGGFVDLQFQNGGSTPVAASDATLQSLTAAYDISSSSAALAPGSANGYFQGFREQQSGTFEIVFNVSNTAAGNEQVLIDIGGGRGLSLVLDGNTLKAGVNGNADTIGLTQTLANGWHHAVVVVGDGPAAGADDDFTLYLNNVLVDSQTNVQIDDYSGDNNWGFGGTPGAVVVDPTDGTATTLANEQDYHGDIALIRYYLAEFDSTDVNQNYASLSASQSFVDVDTMTMSGDLTLDSSSTLEIDIWDTTMGNDLLEITGAFTAGGTLDINLIGSVTAGDSFDILDFDAGSVSGAFDGFSLPSLGGGLSWNTSNLLTTGVISVVSGLPGDFNSDGRVDGADFLLWQRNPSVGSLSDWETNYGLPTTASTTSVPEPSSIALVMLCGCGALCRRRR